MRGSSHEALALGASYGGLAAFTEQAMNTGALPLAAMSLGVLVTWEAISTQRQKKDLRRFEEWEASMLSRGLSRAHVEGLKVQGQAPSTRWKGPPRMISRILRLLAWLCAFSVAIPVGVALATARLPDLLEVGPVKHRGLTHWLITAGALIVGTAYVLDGYQYGMAITVGLAVGYLSHLVADGCTLQGVAFLWPVWRDDLHLLPQGLRVRTGSLTDTLAATVVLLAVVLAVAPHGASSAEADGACKQSKRAVRVYLSKARHPHVIAHIKRSWRRGYPHVLRIRRRGADERRERLLARYPTRDGFDRDEAPAAMLRSTVRADVMYVPSSENRSAGASMGNQLRGFCGGTRVVFVFTA